MNTTPYPIDPKTGPSDPSKIVDREEVEKLLYLLKNQSVRLEEIRRMGKTYLVQKLEFRTQNEDLNHKSIYFILQGVHDIHELTDELLSELRKTTKHKWLKLGFNKILDVYHKISETKVELAHISFKIPEFKNTWKESLTAIIEDLSERERENEEEVFTLILDEFPVMLWSWIVNGKATDAMALLDHLRLLRYNLKDKGKIRFLICGSIGMNVVLDKLRSDFQYTGEPLNDFEALPLGNMTEPEANFLCECLYLSGFQMKNELKEQSFRAILVYSERLPYFINKIFSHIQLHQKTVLSPETVKIAFDDIIQNKENSAAEIFDQLESRLAIYYPQIAKMGMQILDELSRKDELVSEEKLLETIPIEKKELQNILDKLLKDQYLRREIIDGQRCFEFKYKIIKLWWKINKA
jgi:hypothetical protein